MASLIVLLFIFWSAACLVAGAVEWLRHTRPLWLVGIYMTWFVGGAVLVAARVLFT